MRKALDGFYAGCLAIAATGMVCILVAVTAQIVGRMAGFLVPSAPEIAGYSMAVSSFMALPYTFRLGAHIRVSLLIANISGRSRRAVEFGVLAVALGIVAFLFIYVFFLTVESYEFGDVSSGVIAIPLWIPQTFISFGIFALVVAIADELVQVLRGSMPSYYGREERGH